MKRSAVERAFAALPAALLASVLAQLVRENSFICTEPAMIRLCGDKRYLREINKRIKPAAHT